MKTLPHLYPARRILYHDAQRPFNRNFFSWLGGRRSSRRVAPGSRPRGRSREDQVTIEVLRFRVAHPEAVAKKNGTFAYSAAFRDFIVQRFAFEQEKLTRREFAQAAEIPFDTLSDWLAAAAPAEAPEKSALAKTEVVSAAVVEQAQLEPASAARARAPFSPWATFARWLRAQFHPDAFEFFYLTDYGRKELRRIYQKNASRGLALAVVLHISGLMIYWSTLQEGEDPKTVTIFKYVEIEPTTIPEAPRANRRKMGGGAAETTTPGAPAPGQPGPINVPENFVPTAAIDQLKEIAQLGRPSTPGLAPPQRITSSLRASTLPELDIGSIGFADKRAPDYQAHAGVGLPSASAVGNANGYGTDLEAARVGYGGGVPGGTGAGGSGGSGGYGYGPGRGRAGSGIGPGTGTGSGTGLKSAVERKGQAPPPIKVEVKEKNLETVDLNRVFLELLEWLKSHQSELGPVLKHYLRYRPGDLTADIKIETAPVDYDLFILCNEHSQDIGILLVEQVSGDAIMLRDTGFRKKSFYLSKGRASRDEDHIVSSLTMLENSPTRSETSQFYNIFLSWWDNNRKK